MRERLRRLLKRRAPVPAGESMGDVLRHWHPVMAASALRREPRRVMIANRAYVLFRDAMGVAHALEDVCPHRFAPLSEGRVRPDGRLACPYHGWHFDGDGQGQSPSQPELKKCDVASFSVVERHGYVWLAQRGASLDGFPSVEKEGFEPAGTFTMLFEAPLHVALDNFSENEHTPWVHTRLGWDAATTGEVTFDAQNFDDRTEVKYRAPQRVSVLGPVLLLKPGDVFHNEWVTRFNPPRTEYSIYWTRGDDENVRPVVSRAVIFFVPETRDTTRYHVFTQIRLDPTFRALKPLIKRAALALAYAELDDDRRFIPILKHTPLDLRGMRLGKFDKPLIHNRKLLRRIYFGESDQESSLRVVS